MIPYGRQDISQADIDAVVDVLRSDWLTQGPMVPRFERALGSVDYGLKSSEMRNVKFRRSLYFVNALRSGDKIKAEDIRGVRPGYGVAPKYFDKVVGKRLKKNVEPLSPVQLEGLYDE